MNINQILSIPTLIPVLILLIGVSKLDALGSEKKGYVIDFTMKDGTRNKVTAIFTEDFEEALIQTKRVLLLQRRHYDKLFSQLLNERRIIRLEDVPQATIDTLKSVEASFFIFGIIDEPITQTTIKIEVTAQNFDGKILSKESTFIDREKIFKDNARRKKITALAKSFSSSLVSLKKTYPLSPTAAGIMSYIAPGSAHIFAGDTYKGTALLVIGYGGLALGLSAQTAIDNGTDTSLDRLQNATGILMFVGAAAYAIFDSVRDAKKAQSQNVKMSNRYELKPYFTIKSSNNQVCVMQFSVNF